MQQNVKYNTNKENNCNKIKNVQSHLIDALSKIQRDRRVRKPLAQSIVAQRVAKKSLDHAQLATALQGLSHLALRQSATW